MVLNMPHLGKHRKSLQTLWKDSRIPAIRLLSASEVVCVDFAWIRNVPKLADFEEKAWAIARGFEDGAFC